jgi:cardiolipin synthase
MTKLRRYTEAELYEDWERVGARAERVVQRNPPSRPARRLAKGALLALAPFALIGLQRTFRARPPHWLRNGDEHVPSASNPDFPERVEQLTRAVFRSGNEVEMLCNGDETLPRLWSDLESAQRSIEFQIYYGESGQVADRTFAILEDRARAGVRVRFLYDPVGCRGLARRYLEALREAGAHLYPLRPLHFDRLDQFNHRAHSRIVLVDGNVGYTGDFGISDKWLGDGRSNSSWRSINARFRGPALREHVAAFIALWIEATGELITGEGLSAEAVSGGGKLAALLHSSPTIGSTAAERVWALTLASARETCFIASGYFAPTASQVQRLAAAARRGVDVRVLTASASHTDVPPAYWAGRSRYPELFEAGVKIYEYQPSMMHAKSWVVDGIWCSVGALNLDNRSVALNDEVALMIHDADFGTRLQEIFRSDLALARRVDPEDVQNSGWLDRNKAWSAYRINALL